MSTPARLTHRVREGALWLGAVLGALCLVLGVLALVFDVRPLVLKSGSMSPEIEAGALALAHQVPASELAVGDVVSVESGRNVRITHRIVSIESTDAGTILHLKGDANAAPDAESYPVDDAYRVFADVPWAGHVVQATSAPWGLLLCGGFVTLLLVTAFGRGRRQSDDPSSGESDDGAGASGGGSRRRVSEGAHRATRKAVVATSATMLVAGGVALTPLGTMATFTDTSVVTGGSLKALTVTPPANVVCQDGVFEWLTINWTHPDVRNVEYKVVVTKVSDGSTVQDYGWRPAPAVGQSMSQEIRATGDPRVPGLGNFWATVTTRIASANGGWTTSTKRIPIRKNLVVVVPIMFCGHL